MKTYPESLIKRVTGASEIGRAEVIQNLWSNYGQIVRYKLKGGGLHSIVVKHVLLKEPQSYGSAAKTNHSHERKLRSYQVETMWYNNYSALCDDHCRVPHCLAIEMQGDEVMMVLEDLDVAGYPIRKRSLQWSETEICLRWLANFHATFMGKAPEGLWESGTYWHLETRTEELEALDDIPLKSYASLIDLRLKQSPFQTLVHGDAKLANFCFSTDGKRVAAVDFQYVGAGCGMKDVAYFIGSCMEEEESEEKETSVLDCYFSALKEAIQRKNINLDILQLDEDWRNMYHVAWADFHRFYKGWSPGHWKADSYSERICRKVIATLKKDKETGK